MAASKPALTDIPGLVALLYRADWTQLCLSAEISTRAGQPRGRGGLSRVLLAPGGRCRVEDVVAGTDRFTTFCDGETWWLISPGEAAGLHGLALQADFAELLDPSWLIGRFDLELTGLTEAAGRPAWQVTATPRPLAASAALDRSSRIDRVEVLVDVELGILLRREAFSGGKQAELAEMRSLTLDPAEAGDPDLFRPPPGHSRAQGWPDSGPLSGASGSGWRVVMTGARAASAVLSFGVRQAGHKASPESTSPPMPEPGQPPAPGEPAPVSDDLVNLLHRTGLPSQRFAAGVRKWSDRGLLVRCAGQYWAAQPPPLSAIMGPAELWNALAGQPSQCRYQTARLQVAMLGKYRIDYLAGGWKTSVSACDGTRQWTVYPDRVITGSAGPLSEDWADLADPAWLLGSGWRLSAAGAQDVDGRRGWRIWADAADETELRDSRGPRLFRRAAVVIDAELGILLRLAFLVDDRPAVCFELHDVTVPPADDAAGFRLEIPPGTRVVESSSPLARIDVPPPLRAAWTAGKAGLAGASAVAGWLQKHQGRHGEPDDHGPGS